MKKSNLVFNLALQTIGYILLFVANWKIAIGIFLIHWAINSKIKFMK